MHSLRFRKVSTSSLILLGSAFLLTCSSSSKYGAVVDESRQAYHSDAARKEGSTTQIHQTTGERLQQAIASLAGDIQKGVSGKRVQKAAVMPLTTLHGIETTLGLYIADKLTNALSVGTQRIDMVERARISVALGEMKLGASGLLSEETIQRTGMALGADAVIVGTITELGDEIDVSVRIFSVATLRILGQASHLLEKDEVINSLMNPASMSSGTGPPIRPERDSLSNPKEVITFLSDLEWTRASAGSGFVMKDHFARNRHAPRHPLMLNSVEYGKGLYAHAPSVVSYRIGGQYERFQSDIGLWNCGNPLRGIQGLFAGKNGSVVFQVWVDGVKLYDSGVLRWNDCQHVSVSVAGGNALDLVVEDGGDGNANDWSVWADAKLVE